ncbi:ABC-2 type transport system permease protein [Microbacterium halimionae]|uniref:ABC-2 type transport system permease protein n=1 Tax=Microbacterium halimionae TaxID=1526413 RepID=A0A7W3PKX2_9MICO|nr:hypothetical protein [Microbacterium halimionae]MBA8815279.1 ABC-2 type transport system permease protein [Microbacterium halimionae]NII93930.1 ABC-2 type transport system permease protein [Microbacterium halimionae]
MVATVLKLRYRILGNTLASSPWQLIGFIVGSLWALFILLGVTAGLIALSFTSLDAVRSVITAGGAVLTLGWILGPIFVSGLDTTVDAGRLAPFPISTRQLMVALTAAGFAGVPGIATTLGALATFAAWWRFPAAALAAIVCVPLGVLVCVVASRTMGALAAGSGGSRRTKELISIGAFLLLALAGPILVGILNLADAATSTSSGGFDLIAPVISGISWTPIGAAWAVPGDLAAGALLPALVKFAIALASVGLLWWLWQRSLAASLVSPPRSATKKLAIGSLGWFGRFPSGGAGATLARSITSWTRDPRYLRQLLVVPLIPALLLFYSYGDLSSPFLTFSAVLVAFLLGSIPYTDVSYDGTAFAAVLAAGVRGRDDRAGRMLGAAFVGVPAIIVIAVATIALSGNWALLPAILGASLGALLTGYGMCAVSSAILVVPVAAPGDNPFKRVPGQTFLQGLAYVGFWAASGVLSLPAFALAVAAAVTGNALFGWVALGVGVVLGSVLFWIGVVVGGHVYDRNAPKLLERLHTFKGM